MVSNAHSNHNNADSESSQEVSGDIQWYTSHDERLQDFLRLYFVGNPNAYAIQQADGTYFPATKSEKEYTPLEDADLERHVKGERTIGTYPVLPEKNECCILVLDFDLEDPKALAQLGLCLNWLKEWFKHHSIEALIEPSGNKGGHLWVLFKGWVPAAKARKLGKAAVAAAENKFGSQPYTIEIFPKQDEVEQNRLGNLIKLPWGVHQETGRRTTFIDKDGAPLPNDGADVIEALSPISEKMLNGILKEVSPKQSRVAVGIPPCIETILNGVSQGCRDEAAFVLSRYFLQRGYSEADTLEKLCNWNVKNQPPYTEKELEAKVKSASAKGYPFTCKSITGNNLLAAFCVGEDKCSWLQQQKAKKSAGDKQAQKLIEYTIQDGIYLFTNHHGDPCARISINQHFENLLLDTKDFSYYLGGLLYQKDGEVAYPDAIRSAKFALSGQAMFGQKRSHPLSNRFAWHEDAIYYDLSDEGWRAVKVTSNGWEIVEQPPVLFRRYKRQIPQVEPVKGGDPFLLLDLVRVKEEDQLLLLVYAISCLIPDIPHPILWVQGPEGSAKSGLCRVLAKVIDPSSQPLLTMPNQQREIVQLFDHAALAIFDNVQSLTDWQADSLCRAVTGDGFSKRELYSNDDDIIYSFKRSVGLNAINLDTDRPDLLDRAIILRLEAIPDYERLTEDGIERQLEKVQASIIGGFFDTISKAMAIRPQVSLKSKPRMADFAEWGYAICQALGRDPEDFIEAYRYNRRQRRKDILDEQVVANVLLHWFEGKTSWGVGTATDLLKQLDDEAATMGIDTKAKGWPKLPHFLTQKLNKLKVSLQKEGVTIKVLKDQGPQKSRGLEITRTPEEDAQKHESEASASKEKVASSVSSVSQAQDSKLSGETLRGDANEIRDAAEIRCLASTDAGDATSTYPTEEADPSEIEF